MTAVQHPLRMAVVGLGNMGTVHLNHLVRLASEGTVELVGGVDPTNWRREACRTQFKIDTFATQRDLFHEKSLDAVVIAVPNAFHRETSVEALEAGKHVLVEKPPAMNVAEVQEMVSAADRANRVLLNGLVYRHMVPAAALYVPQLGSIWKADAWWKRRRGIPGWGGYTDPTKQGGGAFIDLGVHIFDLVWWLMGCPPPLRVSGSMFDILGRHAQVGLSGPWDRTTFEVEDTATATIIFPGGVRVSVEASFASNTTKRDEDVGLALEGKHEGMLLPLVTSGPATKRFRPRVLGEEVLRDDKDKEGDEKPGVVTHKTLGPPNPPTLSEGYARQLRHFVACCRGNADPIVKLEQVLVLQRVIDAFYESARGTGPVVLAEEGQNAGDPGVPDLDR